MSGFFIIVILLSLLPDNPTYDVLNRLPWRIEPLNGTTGFTYDGNGNLLSVTDRRSTATAYTYDNMDGLATRVNPLTRSESYQYDLAGDMTQLMDRKSKVKKRGRQTNILPAVAGERATRSV